MTDYVERCEYRLFGTDVAGLTPVNMLRICQRDVGHSGPHSMQPDGRTLKQLAKEAYDVQDASNLTGVVNSFYKALCDLRKLPGLEGNQAYQNHAITRAWVDKIATLSGMYTSGSFEALREVRRLKDEP